MIQIYTFKDFINTKVPCCQTNPCIFSYRCFFCCCDIHYNSSFSHLCQSCFDLEGSCYGETKWCPWNDAHWVETMKHTSKTLLWSRERKLPHRQHVGVQMLRVPWWSFKGWSFPLCMFATTSILYIVRKQQQNTLVSGSEINFFRQAPTGDQNFFSVAKWKNLVAKKCW